VSAAISTITPREPGTRAAAGRIDVSGIDAHAGDRQVLHDVALTVEPGQLVAIAGGSGAGKTTLLQVMAGLRRPSSGVVLHGGHAIDGAPASVGYVPQDDIIHRELPLRRTLRYAAGLRLPAGTTGYEIERVVDETMVELDLADRADVRVGSLSGGQRKRASTAVELLTRPRLFFLDEPTAGLDPSTSAEVIAVLRDLTEHGVTVVVTTHDTGAIERSDRVVFLASDGHLAFDGTPADALRYFDVQHLDAVYRRLASELTPDAWARRFSRARGGDRPASPTPALSSPQHGARATRQGTRQWWLLSRRTAEVLLRNRLTLAILVGSPALVTAMMAVLFRPGAFDATGSGAMGPVQSVFWIAFAGFFFGLTYGLLQIVGEVPVLRREHRAGVALGPYVLSKITVLTPLLALVAALLLGVLRALDRLPAVGPATFSRLFVTLLIESVAALTLGLLASALVADAAQATLALPMLCFPQVLFAGAVVPVAQMAGGGQVISTALVTRWAFEALGRSLTLDPLTRTLPVMAPYDGVFTGAALPIWLLLSGFAVVGTLATVTVLRHKMRVAS
jgi:ABC transport system ATP-binding/permease protein